MFFFKRDILVVSILFSLGTFSSDLFVSCLPEIEDVLKTSVLEANLTISLFLGMGVLGSTLFWLGRSYAVRDGTFYGLASFLLFMPVLTILFFPSIEGLLVGRCVQGIAIGILQSLVFSWIKNNGDIAKRISSVGLIGEMLSVCAPTLGYILLQISWEFLFCFSSIFSVCIARLGKSILFQDTQSIIQVLSPEKKEITIMDFLRLTTVTSLQTAVAWSLICLIPFFVGEDVFSDFSGPFVYTVYCFCYGLGCFVAERDHVKKDQILEILPYGYFIVFWLFAAWMVFGIVSFVLLSFWLFGILTSLSYGPVIERVSEAYSGENQDFGPLISLSRTLLSTVFVLFFSFLYDQSPFISASFLGGSILILSFFVFVILRDRFVFKRTV